MTPDDSKSTSLESTNSNHPHPNDVAALSIKTLFQKVTSMVQKSSPPLPLSDEVKLQLYGLYKRATVGMTSSEIATTTPPSRWNIVAFRKYQAWEECNEFSEEESMEQYVQVVASLDCDLGRECNLLLHEFHNNNNDNNLKKDRYDDEQNSQNFELQRKAEKLNGTYSKGQERSQFETEIHTSNDIKKASMKNSELSLITKLTGLKPFTPRGQLDISTFDLLGTFIKSIPGPFNNTSISTNIQIEEQIEQVWNQLTTINVVSKHQSSKSINQHVLTGLSVRSLLDLYLTAKSYPKGSEVIIVPPISIEGLIDVIQYHHVKIVPIDIESFEKDEDPILSVDIEKVRGAISEKTVGVLIVHPFGLVCMDDDEMYALKEMVLKESKKFDNRRNHRIEVWEDCAECYTGGMNGRHGYNGSPYVDVQFFSFGIIKTATALGGGIAIIREYDDSASSTNIPQRMIVDKMKRLQQMTYDDQTRMEYFIKVCKALLLHFFSKNLVLLGTIIHLMQFMGMDYDHFVTSSVKGFPSKHSKAKENVKKRRTTEQIIEENNIRARNLIQRLRKRPCTALLLLLHERIRKARKTQKTVRTRVSRCKVMTNMIKENIPGLQLPTGCVNSSQHLFWLYPIIVSDPDAVCRQMKEYGYDVPRGTSQLGCVSSFLFQDEQLNTCPNTQSMMDRILYLPTASTSMSNKEMEKITLALKDSIDRSQLSGKHSGKATNLHWRPLTYSIAVSLLFILDGIITRILPLSRETSIFMVGFVKVLIPIVMSSACCIFIVLHIMRVTMGRYYINCSTTFAKYNSIFNESSKEESKSPITPGLKRIDCNETFQQSTDLFESQPFLLPEIDSTSCSKGEKNFVVLTGATGFIGSLLLRELLYHRKQLGIEGVVLICRSKREQSATDRIANLLNNPMFSFLDDCEKEDLVMTIEGDVAAPNIGLNEADTLRLEEINVTHVFNSAACVRFTEPLEIAAESNITSALQLQQLTKILSAKYIYLSTAFIHGNQTGTNNNPLAEKLFDFGQYDPLTLYESMMGSQSCASKAMHDLGFPNTYTFSKSICEHLLSREKSIETIIIRPSIVGPALQEPYEGWAGEKPSTLVAGACLYMKNPYNLWTFRRELAPVVPVDVVCRFILAKSFDKSLQKSSSKSFDENSNFSDESYRSSELSYVFTKSSTMKSDLSSDDSTSTESMNEVIGVSHLIYTAAWNTKSPKQTGFMWYDFACAIVQLSSVKGHVELSIAYFVLLISFRIFLAMDLTFNTFQKLHKLLVQKPFHVARRLGQLLRFHAKVLRDLERVSAFLDLPLLFYPFTTKTFHFSSELNAPISVNGERYMISCILAAEKFTNSINHAGSTTSTTSAYGSENFLISGKEFKRGSSDVWWALTQPKGSYVVRLLGFFVSKLLKLTTSEVTVDMASLSKVARTIEVSSKDMKPYIILAPTHRSYLDFILMSFLTFSIPEVGIPIPTIAAADDFASLPILGFIAQFAGAFFIRRGKGCVDPGLKSKIDSLKLQHTDESPTCIEVFLEGKRSRDRRFIRGKTGFLRCLNESGGKYLVVPLVINYEQIPEQTGLALEAEGSTGSKMCIFRLFSWLKSAFKNEVNLGKIHITACDSLLMESTEELDIVNTVKSIQKIQQDRVLISLYHIKIIADVLNLDRFIVERSLEKMGYTLVTPQDYENDLNLPKCLSSSEKWTILLQGAHLFTPLLRESHPQWANWMNPLDNEAVVFDVDNDIMQLKEALVKHMEAADCVVQSTLSLLGKKGFTSPSKGHILQYASKAEKYGSTSKILVNAAISMRNEGRDEVSYDTSAVRPLFRSTRRDSNNDSFVKNNESFGAWGYVDSKFIVSVQSNGAKWVTMSGNRYDISGKSMPKLIPFLEKETDIKVDVTKTILPYVKIEDISICQCDLSADDIESIVNLFQGETNRFSIDPIERARHGTGHSQEDMFMIRSGEISKRRVPDIVVWPRNEVEVEKLISLGVFKQWCIIPFGGGTNVSHATWCPPKEIEPRPIISLDMRLMNSILEVNEEDCTVHVQAGITGSQLMKELESLGFTMGHEPDSIEFSTVGGWIATNSSGMKRNKYGNIEDIVKDVRVATSTGILWQHNKENVASFGRVSTGTNLSSLIFGSEGALGVVTSAVLKIWPLPSMKTYESVVLHNFEDGIRFVKGVAKLGCMKPASIRLLDNTQFRLGQAMKPDGSLYSSLKSMLAKNYVNTKAGKFHSHHVVCATATFEGSPLEVKIQLSHIKNLARKHGGICAGEEVGRAGYNMTYAIAYIRDFALTFGFLAESFETFVPWSKVAGLINSTKLRLSKEHSERALPGKPIICARITQLYDQGVCVYFYFCMNFKNVPKPSEVFSEIEIAAREEILVQGGSLSHHHGIGKAKANFMGEVNSDSFKNVLMKVKDAFDPSNIFGVRNGSYF